MSSLKEQPSLGPSFLAPAKFTSAKKPSPAFSHPGKPGTYPLPQGKTNCSESTTSFQAVCPFNSECPCPLHTAVPQHLDQGSSVWVLNKHALTTIKSLWFWRLDVGSGVHTIQHAISNLPLCLQPQSCSDSQHKEKHFQNLV
jgi:hypothetical protein